MQIDTNIYSCQDIVTGVGGLWVRLLGQSNRTQCFFGAALSRGGGLRPWPPVLHASA